MSDVTPPPTPDSSSSSVNDDPDIGTVDDKVQCTAWDLSCKAEGLTFLKRRGEARVISNNFQTLGLYILFFK